MRSLTIRAGVRLVRLLAAIAPRWRRDDWRQEWESEIEFRCERLERTGRLTAWSGLALSVRCLGAIPHLLWMWRHEWSFDMLSHDIHYAFRTLAARPAFTLTAVLTLALGIGANTALFSVVDRLFLRPSAMEHEERLVAIWPQRIVSKNLFTEARQEASAFERMAAYSNWTFTLTGRGEAERLEACGSSAGFFDVLGVRPALGRTFASDEDRPGRDGVVVISDRLWRRTFAGDLSVAGQTMRLGGTAVTIVGVMPPDFEFPRATTDVWRPLPFDASNARDFNASYLSLIGRLAPGVSVNQGREAMQRVAAGLAARNPKFPKDFSDRLTVAALRRETLGATATTVLILFGAVGCVLLVACANVASLLLARASSCRREIAVRSALGAGRLQLVRQVLVESVMLALAGCSAGLLVARSGIQILASGLPPSLPGVAEIGLDLRVLLFSVVISLITALLFGIAPAIDLSRAAPGRALESGARSTPSRGSRRLRRVLVVGEIAVAVILVTGAGLLVKSLWRMTHVEPGFAPDRLLTLRVSISSDDNHAVQSFQARLFERLRALPGVTRVGAIHLLPMSPGNWDPDVNVEGRAVEPARRPTVNWRAATSDYFRAMQIPVIRGRLFTDADEGGEPVALVNQSFADRVFPGEDPIGRRVATFFEGDKTWARIIGIVGDIRQQGPATRPKPEMYRPLAQYPLAAVSVVIETTGAPGALSPVVRRAVAEVDADAPVWNVMTMRTVMGMPIAQDRFFAELLACFALVTLTLGAVGVFGVISYDVAQQTREIGVRLALGADPSRVRRAVLADGMRMTAAGLVLGLMAALSASRLLTGFLFGVSPTDPATLASVPAILAGVSLMATYLPARRAAGVDPIVALRGE